MNLQLANDLLQAECRFYITERMRGNKTFRSDDGEGGVGFYILDGAGDRALYNLPSDKLLFIFT